MLFCPFLRKEGSEPELYVQSYLTIVSAVISIYWGVYFYFFSVGMYLVNQDLDEQETGRRSDKLGGLSSVFIF